MKSLYTILLFSIFSLPFTAPKAQTVRVFSKTGIPKGTYSTIAAALATTTDGDSMVLSAHTFKESRLRGNFSVVYQGTISGGDTTTIDAMGNGSVFERCVGKVRDVIIQGGKYVPPPGGSSGSGIYNVSGFLHLTGNTIIRNNLSQGTGGAIIYDGIIDENVKIINNTGTVYVGGLYAYNDVVIKDNVIIANNFGNYGSAIAFSGSNGVLAKKKKLRIEGNVRIYGNKSDTTSTLYFGNGGCLLEIVGGSIDHNISNPNRGGAIYSFVPPSSLPFDSIGVPDITLNNVRIFNPLIDGKRQPELYIGDKIKPVKFHTEGCWWGSNDTTGLIVVGSGTDFTMPNWAVTRWYGVTFGSMGSRLHTQMLLNTGAALPPNCFAGLAAQYSAIGGSFSSSSSIIDAGNHFWSDYMYPTSGPFSISASIDADTFRANNKGALGIAERGFEQFKIYPNPFVSELRAEGLPLYSMIRLYDAQGKMVYYRYAEESQCSLSLGHLPAGQYSLKITSADGQVGSTKLTKE